MGKKNRMGMGLDQLFADNTAPAEDEEKKQEQADAATAMVRISLLEPNKDQPREHFDQDKLQELADSIKENGVLQPILVRPLENGGYQIVAGERRWRASRLAGLSEVPVYVKELTDKQTMQMALIENIQRQDLSPLEESAAYQSLMDSYGMTQQQVAEAVGKSRSAVANSVRLLSLCDEVKKMLDDGVLSAGHAKVLAGLERPEQLELAAQVEEQSLTVRQLEARAAAAGRSKDYSGGELDRLKKSSVKKDRPFLKEFELSVNSRSNVKVKTKAESDGGTAVTLRIGRETDIENILGRLAELLTEF